MLFDAIRISLFYFDENFRRMVLWVLFFRTPYFVWFRAVFDVKKKSDYLR